MVVIIFELLMCHFKSSRPHLFLGSVTTCSTSSTSTETNTVQTFANFTLPGASATYATSNPEIRFEMRCCSTLPAPTHMCPGSVLPNANLCAQHTIRPNKLKHRSLEQRNVSYRAMQGDRWLMPKKP